MDKMNCYPSLRGVPYEEKCRWNWHRPSRYHRQEIPPIRYQFCNSECTGKKRFEWIPEWHIGSILPLPLPPVVAHWTERQQPRPRTWQNANFWVFPSTGVTFQQQHRHQQQQHAMPNKQYRKDHTRFRFKFNYQSVFHRQRIIQKLVIDHRWVSESNTK